MCDTELKTNLSVSSVVDVALQFVANTSCFQHSFSDTTCRRSPDLQAGRLLKCSSMWDRSGLQYTTPIVWMWCFDHEFTQNVQNKLFTKI